MYIGLLKNGHHYCFFLLTSFIKKKILTPVLVLLVATLAASQKQISMLRTLVQYGYSRGIMSEGVFRNVTLWLMYPLINRKTNYVGHCSEYIGKAI